MTDEKNKYAIDEAQAVAKPIKGIRVVPGLATAAIFKAIGPTDAAAGPSAIRLVIKAVTALPAPTSTTPDFKPIVARPSTIERAIQ